MSENPFQTPETQAQTTPAANGLSQAPEVGLPLLVTRSLFGGLLMGLANLVPGISGGTMYWLRESIQHSLTRYQK